MYATTYQNLSRRYPESANYDFESIAKAITEHFGYLFKLDVLNAEFGKAAELGSYARLFNLFMMKLGSLYTVKEVVEKINKLLQEDEGIRNELLNNLIFVPPTGTRPSVQLGFLEKIATGTIEMPQPVTFIDMMRAVNGLKNFSKKADFPFIGVVNLNDLRFLDAADVAKLKTNKALIVNFNCELNGIPKWGVVDLRANSERPIVYCETPLTEPEKSNLETNLKVSVAEFKKAAANSLPSTGYTALAWLDKNITKVWNFDINADFASLMQDYSLIYFGGDQPGHNFKLMPSEIRTFCTPAFSRIAASTFADGTHEGIDRNSFQGGRALFLLSHAAVLGQIDGESFTPGDLGAVIKISQRKGWVFDNIKPLFLKGGSTWPRRFDATMSAHESPKLLIEPEDGSSITLNIPEFIDIEALQATHEAACLQIGTSSDWLKSVPDLVPRDGTKEEFTAVMMVFTLIRAKAKKRVLNINLPEKYQLNKEEQAFVVATLSENAYITEFNVNENTSLKALRALLLPTFARNRWLAENEYRPPMVDNYWKQAAKYWLLHLYKHPNVLEPTAEHIVFKRCVSEMGTAGLDEVLKYLDTEQEHLERVYEQVKPAFYAACQPSEMPAYLRRLITHLARKDSYFPFNELAIAYQEEQSALFIELLGKVNLTNRFDKITLTDFITAAPSAAEILACKTFLTNLIQQAQVKERPWVGLVVIPGLENKENTSVEFCELQSIYTLLNDVILKNRHALAAHEELNRIETGSDFINDLGPAVGGGVDDAWARGMFAEDAHEDDAVDGNIFSRFAEDVSWPLKKGAVVQLQLQQQQQIEQNMQKQQEQQRVVITPVEESLVGELVNYDNIGELLGGLYAQLLEEKVLDEKKISKASPLRTDPESVLQGFFHTWVNANPVVDAKHAIRLMTADAAKALLRKHRLLPSGLNPDNLPKGFYTQRSKDGQLILCYNAQFAYVKTPNKLTLELDVAIPEAREWDGDFRQFNIAKYLEAPSAPLDVDDWSKMVLFAELQPKKDYEPDFNAFELANPTLHDLLMDHRAKLIAYWPIFMQAWKCKGVEGFHAFINKAEVDLIMPPEMALQQLLHGQSDTLRLFAASVGNDKAYLCALGQVYHRYGDKGIKLLLQKLFQIKGTLGDDFFETFNKAILKSSTNFSCFMTVKFFSTMDRMISSLREVKDQKNKQNWQDILRKHIEIVGWDNVDTLWDGYSYFIGELELMGIKLEGNEFREVRPENMLMCMDRVLESLRHIAIPDLQKHFLKHLHDMDRTHGGVPYALKYEGFKYAEKNLNLYQFNNGSPTYAPDLNALYEWSDAQTELKIQRTLASQRQFSHAAYLKLSARLVNKHPHSKHWLMWLLHTQYSNLDIDEVMDDLHTLDYAYNELIGRHLHAAVHTAGNLQIMVNMDGLVKLATFYPRYQARIDALLVKYPHGTFVEAISILAQSGLGRWNARSLEMMLTLFETGAGNPAYFQREGYKLAVMFGVDTKEKLQQFNTAIAGMLPVVQHELHKLITQLLSLDFATSNLTNLRSPANWTDLLYAIEAMKRDPLHTEEYRIDLIGKLIARGLEFKYSKNGNYRALSKNDADKPSGLDVFIDHEDRLWAFIKGHIAVPAGPGAKSADEALQPIVLFLKKLQLNRTYLNEIEPLLASLEGTAPSKYWTSTYFLQLLRALQPADERSAFPISLLKVILQGDVIAAKGMDSLEDEFPQLLHNALQTIINSDAQIFDRSKQAILCQIALREFKEEKAIRLLPQILTTLSLKKHEQSRAYVLEILGKCETVAQIQERFTNCRWLLDRDLQHVAVTKDWPRTASFWLKSISAPKSEEALFLRIKTEFAAVPGKQALIFHIVAWSCLRQGLKTKDEYEWELRKKASKLVTRLGKMSDVELAQLANCYPQQPSPTADDILRLIKNKNDKPWLECLETFKRKPFPEARGDFGVVASTREADLRRMIKETAVSGADGRARISAESTTQLTLIFAQLKRLESGLDTLMGATKPISEMNQTELAAAFKQLSEQSIRRPHDDLIRAQIWAVMFEVLGRTTRKYPHLAQQFALIANDVCIKEKSRVLQLATGEGKSHFVAMRAARHAGQGKVVDICTAKRTLAERDHEDYQSLFSYLGLTSAYIDAKSSPETYLASQIHYSTTGDMSLFLDEQSYVGKPIIIPPADRVALFDEFDFIRYDEGCKTQYNYARPTGRTPKQMTWFYQEVNDFYTSNKGQMKMGDRITQAMGNAFAASLKIKAGDSEEKNLLIKELCRDPLQLILWLQSAHEAHELVRGKGFAVRDENIKVGDELYPMREIIPLSSDNQKMVGSTFSAGVHQLLAVRMNTLAKLEGKPQNFHIHAESNIISSQIAAQRMHELWGSWEGFSGTISAAQAAALYVEQNTEVLHVPTNQRDLRLWHKAKFCTDQAERLNVIASQLHKCFDKKQSILFSCKDDTQVASLKIDLEKLHREGRLTDEEFESIIFYTNEDPETASEILDVKKQKEDWQANKKTKGICLVASGFGRGDNVGVEAVILLNVNDMNDLLQKGGRTARNGEEGEVFQFYLPEELIVDETKYKAQLLMANADIDFTALEKAFPKVLSNKTLDDENCFNRVLLLSECLFTLQNEANQAYHSVIAKYTTWGMGHLGRLQDQSQRESLAKDFSKQLHLLEKEWINISSIKATTSAQKIVAIEKEVVQQAHRFIAYYNGRPDPRTANITGFKLDKQVVPPTKLVVPTVLKPEPADRAIAVICSALTQLPDLTLSDERVAQVHRLVGVLATNDGLMQRFANQVAGFRSVDALVHALEIAAEQAGSPSPEWNAAYDAAAATIVPAELLTDLSDEKKVMFSNLMWKLLPPIQSRITNYLRSGSIIAMKDRIESILPVLNFLNEREPDSAFPKFTDTQLLQWGPEYIDELGSLLNETSREMLLVRLKNSPPMSYTHMNGLWLIAKRYDLDETRLAALLQRLGRVVEPAPEQRIRMLTRWDTLARGMSPADSLAFLENFCQVMEQFKEGENWDVFATLVSKTENSWNKGASAYKPELLTLWKKLAERSNDLPTSRQLLKSSMACDGKSWFQILSARMSVSAKARNFHNEQIEELWTAIDRQPIKKSQKSTSFANCLNGLDVFYKFIETQVPAERTRLELKLLSLKSKRFQRMLELMAEHGDLLKANEEVLKGVLDYMSNTNIPLENVEQLSHVLLQSIPHKATNKDCIYRLIEGYSVFMHLLQNPDDRFKQMMLITNANLKTLLDYRNVNYLIMDMMISLTLPMDRAKILSDMLLKATDHQATNNDGFIDFIAAFASIRARLSALPLGKFNAMVGFINDNIQTVLKYEQLLPTVLDYISPPGISLDKTFEMCIALLQVAVVPEANKEKVDALFANFALLREPFLALQDNKYRWMLAVINADTARLLQYPQILPTLMGYLCAPKISVIHAERLREALEAPPAYDSGPLIDVLDAVKDGIIVLPAPKLNCAMELITSDIETWRKSPTALKVVMGYLCDPALPIQNAQELSKVVLQVIAYQDRHPGIVSSGHLFEGIERYRNKSIAVLEMLSSQLLSRNPDHVIESLFDNAAQYLSEQPDNWREPMKASVNLFYRVAKEHKGAPEAMFNNPDIAELFNMANGDADTRKQRVMLMKLLQQQVFVTGLVEEPRFALHDYQWTNAKNEQLLKLGFDKYLQSTKRILDGAPVKTGLSPVRDLSIRQQHALLQLTDDIKFIGRPRVVPGGLDTAAQVKDLSRGLNQLMSTYNSSWFRSEERKQQLVTLQGRVDQILQGAGNKSRYENVMQAISTAKLEAIASDKKLDQHRWFKMNSSGKSRYFITLNQMEDLVLRHWVQDTAAVHSIRDYQAFSRQEFVALTERLTERVEAYNAEKYPLPHAPRSKEFGWQISNFFSKSEDKTKAQSLKKVLRSFCDNHGVNLTVAVVVPLMKELHGDLSKLPGHLTTLANEVLARGDSLLRHLKEQEAAVSPGGNEYGGGPAVD